MKNAFLYFKFVVYTDTIKCNTAGFLATDAQMAKFVVAGKLKIKKASNKLLFLNVLTVVTFPGKADCPKYAEAERLADILQGSLPNFRANKICVRPDEWKVAIIKIINCIIIIVIIITTIITIML